MKKDEKKQGKLEEKPKSTSLSKEAIFQRLKDMGIKVTDVTKELEGKTIIIPTGKPSQNKDEEQ